MFGWFKSQPDPEPAGLRVLCNATVRQAGPGQPTGFFVHIAIRTQDEEDAASRAVSYLYAEGAANVEIDSIYPMAPEEMDFEGDEAEVSGRIFFDGDDS